jgi:TfoX/Sxy family transcriptional regulator of competence genes
MAYDESLAARIRAALAGTRGVVERKMFGGVCFMLRGNMLAGVWKNSLMVRVGPQQFAAALSEPHVRPMDVTGRPMKGLVLVEADGVANDAAVGRWIARAEQFVGTLPDK